MSTVPVPAARATIDDGGSSIRVSVPARRNIAVIAFMLVWLSAWFFGESQVIRRLLAPGVSGPKGFLALWLVAWTLGGVFAARTVLWILFGREVIELRDSELAVRREALGIGRTRTYDLGAIKNLRAAPSPVPTGRSSVGDVGGTSGTIAFDYGPKTIRCGGGLDEAEAGQIVELLKQRNARLRGG
jgi:hypothetical protein